jgi:hypothetical protein
MIRGRRVGYPTPTRHARQYRRRRKAVCRHKGKEYRIDVSSLEWLPERPEGLEWVEAYLAWRENRV